MTSSPSRSSTDGPRYATLQDYLRVVKRSRILIVLIALGFAVGGYVYSATQEETYKATASVSFRETSQDAAVIGDNVNPQQAPAERAAYNAELVTRPGIAKAVNRDLKKREIESDLSPTDLTNMIETQVDTRTNLVRITASTTDADLAAAVANGFARQTEEVGGRQNLRQLEEAREETRRSLKEIREAPESGPRVVQEFSLQNQLSSIDTLIAIADPVRITQTADAPSTPASPQPTRNTIIGGLLGVIFGLLAAFVRDSLDRRLHNPTEVHSELGVPVLGRVSDGALGYPGLARNGRAAMSEADFEAFRILRMNLGFLSSGGPVRSVLVTSSMPEEGKSTVSMSLASAAALAGQRVLLVECDLRKPSFARRLGIEREPGLSDYLLGKAEPHEVLQVIELAEPAAVNGAGPSEPGSAVTLVCITAGAPVQTPAELLVTERFTAFLDKVSRAYDLVVLDSSPILAVVDPLELMSQVDGVLVCTRVQRTTRDQARAARATLENMPERPIGAVVTGLKRGGADDDHYYYGY